MFRDIADKLMRHEHREKGLGDHVKRALDTLDKRQRTLEQHTDVVAASLAGIGERLHVIEGKLSQVRVPDEYYTTSSDLANRYC